MWPKSENTEQLLAHVRAGESDAVGKLLERHRESPLPHPGDCPLRVVSQMRHLLSPESPLRECSRNLFHDHFFL